MFPVGALSAGRTDDEDFQRGAGHVLLRAAARRLHGAAPPVPELERFCTRRSPRRSASLAQLASSTASARPSNRRSRDRLGELVRRAPITAQPRAPVRDALVAMNDAKVRTVVIVDAEQRPVGLFTLVDLLRRVALPERAWRRPSPR